MLEWRWKPPQELKTGRMMIMMRQQRCDAIYRARGTQNPMSAPPHTQAPPPSISWGPTSQVWHLVLSASSLHVPHWLWTAQTLLWIVVILAGCTTAHGLCSGYMEAAQSWGQSRLDQRGAKEQPTQCGLFQDNHIHTDKYGDLSRNSGCQPPHSECAFFQFYTSNQA